MRDFPSPPSLKYPYCHKGMLSSAARAIRQQRLWHSWELNDPSLCCPSISGPGNSPLSLGIHHFSPQLSSQRQKIYQSVNFRSPSGVPHQKYVPWYCFTASQRTRRTNGLLSDPFPGLSLLFLFPLPLRQGLLLPFLNQTVLLPTNPVKSHNSSLFSHWYCVHVSLVVGSTFLLHVCLCLLKRQTALWPVENLWNWLCAWDGWSFGKDFCNEATMINFQRCITCLQSPQHLFRSSYQRPFIWPAKLSLVASTSLSTTAPSLCFLPSTIWTSTVS